MSKGSAFSFVSATSIIGNHGSLTVEDAVEEAWEDDIVDVVGIELGDVLGTQFGYRTVQIPGGSG